MRRALATTVLALLLGACAVTPPVPAPPPVRDFAAIAALDHREATGRIAVRTAQEGFSAHFDWRQAGGDAVLGVRGPLGAGSARLEIGAERIRIESGGEPPLDVPAPYQSLDPLLVTRLGFPLPLQSLRYWLLGVPAPGVPVSLSGAGFEQGGWRVEPTAFGVAGPAPGPLPARLELTRGTTRIRVLVDRWQAPLP